MSEATIARRESAPTTTDVATEDVAQGIFLLLNQYKRWANSHAVQTRLGGDLSILQIWALYLIRTERLTPSTLAKRLLVTPTVVTGIVDRLERRGYVRREDDPTDRRRLSLRATEEGCVVSLAAERTLIDHVASHLTDLTRQERTELGRGLSLLERVLRCLEADDAQASTNGRTAAG